MRAMVLREFNTPLILDGEMKTPRPGPCDVLIRVKACGICRTDLKISKGLYKPEVTLPHVLGHEFSGVVEQNWQRRPRSGDRPAGRGLLLHNLREVQILPER